MLKSTYLFVFIVILLVVTGLYADRLNNQNHLISQQQTVAAKLNLIRANLEAKIGSNLQSINGLVGLIVNEPEVDQQRFGRYVAPLFRGDHQLRNIGLAPNMVISMVYPLEGNKGAIGLNLAKNEDQKAEALQAAKENKIVIAGPINLVQGGQGLIGRIPVNLELNGEQKFWGLISAVINIDKLYEMSGLKSPDLGLEIGIAKLVNNEKSFFFGDKSLMTSEPVEVPILLPSAEWIIVGAPSKGWEYLAPNAWLLRGFFAFIVFAFVIQIIFLEKRKRLHEVEQTRLKALFELSPIGIALNRFEDGSFVTVNQALLNSVNYSEVEFLEKSYWDITPKDYEEEEAKQLESLKTKGEYGPYQKEYIRKDGKRFPVLLSGVLLKDPQGDEYIWSIIEDISERVAYEKALIMAKEQAEAAAKAKSEFLATMSHEIRTPLNGVIGMIDLLSRSQLDDEQKRKLGIAKSSAEFLLVVINDILDFSRIEAGKLELEKISFDIEELISGLIETFKPETQSKNIALSLETYRIEKTILSGDPNRIKQILNNLIGNAIKFTTQGEVKVTYQVEAELGSWRLSVKVEDSGVGIPEKNIPQLFDAFTQVDASTTRKFGGSGLGLAICNRLVQMMEGKIEVKSELDVGSCFSFYIILHGGIESEIKTKHSVNSLPANDPKLNENVALKSSDTNAQDKKILLVEDNEFNREVVVMLLEEVGVEADIAINGKMALSMLKDNPNAYQVILMDCQMPEMDGYEASEHIRQGTAGENYQTTPIIALTANAMKGDKEKCLAAGMTDYLSKPIDGELLIEKIKLWQGQVHREDAMN